MTNIHILAISGSLRRDSFNTRLLRQAQDIAPPGARLGHFGRLADIPLFNEDEEHPAPEVLDGLIDLVARQQRPAASLRSGSGKMAL
jgi:chromate reductase, NAD(P)H dehydrogenase (quinone)